MSFIRPEAAAFFARYSTAFWGLGVALVGLRFALASGVILPVLSIPIFGAAVVLIWWGVRRGQYMARPRQRTSEGVVELTEHRLTFFDSGAGASLSLDAVNKIEIVTQKVTPVVDFTPALEFTPRDEDMQWVFHQRGEKPVEIPSGAVGADEIFDALAAFPGANFDNVIAASQSVTANRFLIWERN